MGGLALDVVFCTFRVDDKMKIAKMASNTHVLPISTFWLHVFSNTKSFEFGKIHLVCTITLIMPVLTALPMERN